MKMPRNLSEKLEQNFPLDTTLGYPMLRIPHLDDAVIELKARPVVGQQLQQKDNIRRKSKGKNKLKNLEALRPRTLSCPNTQNFDFCTCLSKNVIKRDASGEKGLLSCCKCLFEYIGSNLAHIRTRNVQKMCFFSRNRQVLTG